MNGIQNMQWRIEERGYTGDYDPVSAQIMLVGQSLGEHMHHTHSVHFVMATPTRYYVEISKSSHASDPDGEPRGAIYASQERRSQYLYEQDIEKILAIDIDEVMEQASAQDNPSRRAHFECGMDMFGQLSGHDASIWTLGAGVGSEVQIDNVPAAIMCDFITQLQSMMRDVDSWQPLNAAAS